MRCLKTFDNFCFQNLLSNGGGNSKNDTGQTTNQLSINYVSDVDHTNMPQKTRPAGPSWRVVS